MERDVIMDQHIRKPKAEFLDWDGILERYKGDIERMNISEENKKLIRDFDLTSQSLPKTRVNYIMAIKCFLKNAPNKPFRKFERTDFNEWLRSMEGRYRDVTINSYINRLTYFFGFVFDEVPFSKNGTILSPGCMKGIKRKTIDSVEKEIKLRKSILTKEEILRIINTTTNRKFRAMISVLFDGALRKSELIRLTIGDLDIQDGYIDLTVRGKGGRVDIVTLIDSVPFIKDWLSIHPFYMGKDTDPSIPLWIKERHEGKPEPVMKWCIEWLMATLPKKAGIKKHVWIHLTRHSKISSMLAEGYSITEAAQHARHRSLRSTMIYSHVTENGLKEKMLMKAGKLPGKKTQENILLPVNCPRCRFEENPAGSIFCMRCGWEFGKRFDYAKIESERRELEDLKKTIEEMKEFKELFEKRLTERGLILEKPKDV